MSVLRARVHPAVIAELRPGCEAAVTGPEARRLARVSRARAGEAIEVFDGAGRSWRGRVVAVERHRVVFRAEGPGAAADPVLPIVLVQSVLKGDRTEMAVEKATELGVGQVWIAVAERSVRRLDEGGSRPARWERVAEAASRQCGRATLPGLRGPMPWAEAMAGAAALGPGWLKLVAWEGATEPASRVLGRIPHPPNGVAVAVGPEGGLTAQEVDHATRLGLIPVRLGPRVLRAETAAMVLLTLLQARWGDLGT